MRKRHIIFLLVVWVACLQSWAGGGYTLWVGEWVTLEIPTKSVAIGFTLTEPTWSVVEGSSVAHVGDPKGYAHNMCAIRPGLSKVRADWALVNKKLGIYQPMYEYWWITVWGTEPTGMKLTGPSTMVVGETAPMGFQFTPDYERSSVVWTSSDPNIATISDECLQLNDLQQIWEITAHDAGEVIITATSGNGLVESWPITVELAPMTLESSLESGYVEKGDIVVLTASEADAEIRYTLDGSEPSASATLYESPVPIDQTATLWAKAFKKGYEIPEFKGEYKVTPARTVKRFPTDEEFYIYENVNPYVEYEVKVSEGPQFSKAQVWCDDTVAVAGDFILNGKMLAFVPKEPLQLGHYYTVIINEGTVQASNGYPNKATKWTFLTGKYIRSISAGYQQAAAVRTDNTLLYWGRSINSKLSGDRTEDTLWPSPHEMESNVYSASCGFTHNLITKSDGNVSGWGMQFCGEVGSGSKSLLNTSTSVGLQLATPTGQIAAGGQTSAFVNGGRLWMVGRNDFGQVGDTAQVIYTSPVEYSISGGVNRVVPGWQTTFALGNNKTLYGWGDNRNGLMCNSTESLCLKPQDIISGVTAFDLSRWDNSNAAAVTEDGSLYVWGLNDHGQLGSGSTDPASKPVQIMTEVSRVSVGNGTMAALKTDGTLWLWGDNSYGQIGNGTTTQTSEPQKIMDDVADIELGCNFAVALKTDGSVWTWGQNGKSQLGTNQSDAYVATPQQIIEGRKYADLQGVQLVTKDISVAIGEKAVAYALPNPISANYKSWSWSSSNANIATVDSRGVVTGVADGTTTITISVDDAYVGECTVRVGNATERTVSITISSANQVPYYSDQNLDFTEKTELKAYVATGYDKTIGTIWLTRVKQVPAETGFLLVGEEGTYDIPIEDDAANCYYKNMFAGTIAGTTIYTTEGDYTNYYLSKGTSGVGFYKVTNENGQKIGANRCYLPILTNIPADGAEGDAEVIKVSAAKQVPYYTSKNIDFSSLDAQGVKAYTATGYNYKTGIIWLTRVKKVPAQTGILVMADAAGEYSVPTTSVQSIYENMFTGSETAQTIYTTEEIDGVTYINYYLSNGESGVGFYKVTKEEGVSMSANRCYLPIPYRGSSSGARGMCNHASSSFSKMIISDGDDDVIAIPLFAGDATGISDVQQRVGEENVWYNLQGQRVDRPGKGIYIKNGRKVVIK